MATLQVVKGPNVGECYELKSAEAVIGRYPFCEVVLPTHTVSREHARIVHADGKHFIEDLGSLNGTFLNGERVRKRTELHDKDRIRLYEILLLYHEGQAETAQPVSELAPSAAAEADSDEEGPRPLAVVNMLTLQPQSKATSAEQMKLRSFMKAVHELGGLTNLDDVLAKILDGVFDVFPAAEHGHILFAQTPEGSLQPKAIKHRQDDEAAAMTLGPVSGEVARRLMNSGEAILTSTAPDADEDSVFDVPIRTAMYAPLVGPSRTPCGIMHLDTSEIERRFTENDLHLLVSIATIAAQAVEFAMLSEPEDEIDLSDA